MKIPKSFQLQGRTIDVEINNDRCKERDSVGLADLNFNRILLADMLENRIVPKSNVEFAFIHETLHFVLTAMGEDKLSSNEKFVDQFAGFLHQIIETSQYHEGQD